MFTQVRGGGLERWWDSCSPGCYRTSWSRHQGEKDCLVKLIVQCKVRFNAKKKVGMIIWLHESNIQKGKDMMTFQAQDGNKIENSIFLKQGGRSCCKLYYPA